MTSLKMCKLEKIARDLPTSGDYQALQRDLRSDAKTVPSTLIATELDDNGFQVSADVIQRHRREACCCYVEGGVFSQDTVETMNAPLTAGVKVESDGQTIISRPSMDANIDWEDQFRSWGLDPEEWVVVGTPRLSIWEAQTKGGGIVQMHAWKAQVERIQDENGPTNVVLRQAAPVTIKVTQSHAEDKQDGWETVVIFPDAQRPTHDPDSVDVALQILQDCEAKYGVDKIIHLGDDLDLPDFSTHRSAPEVLGQLNEAFQCQYRTLAFERATCPEAEILWLEGNHECLDESTLCLTRQGARHFSELIEGEEVMSIDDDGNTCWQPIQAIHVYDHDGPMRHYKTSGLDMLVTLDHRVVGLTKPLKLWWESPAGEWDIGKRLIPVAGKNTDEDYPISDDHIRLAAWCLTDSTLTERGYWCFHQRESKVDRILDVLSSSGFPATSVSRRQRDITEICGTKLKSKPTISCDVRVGVDQSLEISKIVAKKYELPSWMYELSARQVQILVDEWVFTDGSTATSGGSQMIYCSNDKLRGQLVELLTRNGIRATTTEYRPGHWRVNLSTRALTRECDPQLTGDEVHYKGKVWCITVPNGRFMAMRNERPFLTGNCRVVNWMVDNAPQMVALQRPDVPQEQPVLSIPFLCRLDELDVQYIDPYPEGEIWLNDHLRVIHGDIARSGKGATAGYYLSQGGASTIYGHIHRKEYLWQTRHTKHGPRTFMAGSPGSLCMTSGEVPSAKSGITAMGKQGKRKTEDWQTGILICRVQVDGPQWFSLHDVNIWAGWAEWEGKHYEAGNSGFDPSESR